MVVVAVDESLGDKVKVGDVVLAVDGEPIDERMDQLKKYLAVSTRQSLYRFSALALQGPPLSPARVHLRDPRGATREETLPRPVGQEVGAAARRLFETLQRKTPVFSVLPEGYGYFDLVRLTVPEVNKAFETVKDTPALILDMRGYPKGTAWAICARLTAKPMTMASFRRPFWTSPDSTHDRWAFDQRIEPSPTLEIHRPRRRAHQ